MANPAQHNKLNNLDGEPEVQEQVTLGSEWDEQESDEDTRQTQHQSVTPRDTIDPAGSKMTISRTCPTFLPLNLQKE
jgi:hypothetical protein